MQRTLFLVIVTDYQSGVNSWSCKKKTFKHCLAFNVQPGLLALIIGCLGTVSGASRETLDSFFPKLCKDMYEIHMAQ